ncbi:MAG: amino acid permease [Myxococcota bacterium]|nr:amino acid permease [Myxococcota bacterium]
MTTTKAENRYGTFNGVFVPTIISILGVIMYLRQGWVVGNAGLIWAWAILAFSVLIAFCTALSLSSIASNTRLHAGGAYSIISRSLGLEAGASIGIALYLAQTFAITMYIFGFREGWGYRFPEQNALMVDLVSFGIVFAIAVYSTNLANRVQYAVLAITALSLVSIGLGPWADSPQPITFYGDFKEAGGGYTGFWKSFAVFFPAVTGVMAGANMSGELKEPRKSIPRGTIWAVVISAIIYIWLTMALAQMGAPKQLTSNYYILVDQSKWKWLVEIAILCATSSSALVTLVGAPRILQALANDGAIPFSAWLKQRTPKGEPRNATIITGVIVLISLSFRDLNQLAPVITICFLSTYAAVNGVVLIEQGLGLISFRPRLRFPIWIPLCGAAGSFFAMLVINPSLSIFALALLLFSYAVLTKRGKISAPGDVRGNLFVAIAQWVAREAVSLPQSEARAWLPHPMIPIYENENHSNGVEIALDIAYPRGSIKLLGLGPVALDPMLDEIRQQDVFCTGTAVQVEDRVIGLIASLQALQGAFFRPNILVLSTEDGYDDEDLASIITAARIVNMGIVLNCSTKKDFQRDGFINVWIRPQMPNWSIEDAQLAGNLDLSLLLAIQFAKRHGLIIRLITMIEAEQYHSLAQQYLRDIIDQGRLPYSSQVLVTHGSFWDNLTRGPDAAAHLFGLPNADLQDFIQRIKGSTSGVKIFVRSSGLESVLV